MPAVFPAISQGSGGASGPVTATGSVTPRLPADRFADRLNALDWGIVPDGTTVNDAAIASLFAKAAALSAAAGAGTLTDVVFPNIGGVYGISSRRSVPQGVRIVGLGRPMFRSIGTAAGGFAITTSDVHITGIRYDMRNPTTAAGSFATILNASGNVRIEDVEVVNPGGAIIMTTSSGVTVSRYVVNGSPSHGIVMQGCFDCTISNNWLNQCGAFGVIVTNGSYRNLISYNTCLVNAIELVGVTSESYENRIIGNHAQGTGDNGISVTGFMNTVTANVCKGCAGNGIHLYGDRNTAVGNTCLNNNQGGGGNSGWRGGIAVQGGFGGTGQFNVVAGNICDDDQATPTQRYGVWIGPNNQYPAWASGATKAVGAYVSNNGRMYKSTTAGTTGATAPTHTTGTVSDGGVSWLYMRDFVAGSTASDKNSITSNVIRNASVSSYLDASGGASNEFIGGFNPVVLPSTIVAGQISNPGGVGSITTPNNTYRFLNGANVSVNIGAPNGAGGGQQATAAIVSFFLFGFGTINAGGSGYAVNDVLTLVGGTTTSGALRTVKVTSVDANGAVTGFTAGSTGSYNYSALPSADPQPTTGGTGTGAMFNSPSWHINAITVTSAGSNYTSVPVVTFPGSIGTPNAVAVLASQLIVNAGLGKTLMDGNGTTLGIAGTSGAPVISKGALVDGSGVGTTLTGADYTVPANTSLVRFRQTATIAAQTVVLPAAPIDGLPVQFSNGAGAITALTFSPAVAGFANGSSLAAYTGLRVRWDAGAATPGWIREQ